MIKSIEVHNEMGDVLELDLFHPEKSGFIVRSVEGLGPPKATINSTEIPTDDGGEFNSARMEERNVVFDLEFQYHPTIEDTRHASYRYFPIKKQVTLVITTDNRVLECTGHVESNEPDIFSENEGAQISIICSDPNLYAHNRLNKTPFYFIEPLFEFEFSNESLEDPLLEFGEILYYPIRTINYEGDVDVGIVVKMHAMSEVGDVIFQNTRTREKMVLRASRLEALTGSALKARDEITISTVRGQKGATLLREGIVTNILNCFDRDTDWFQISKGENIFSYDTDLGRTSLQITVENKIVYAGV